MFPSHFNQLHINIKYYVRQINGIMYTILSNGINIDESNDLH